MWHLVARGNIQEISYITRRQNSIHLWANAVPFRECNFNAEYVQL